MAKKKKIPEEVMFNLILPRGIDRGDYYLGIIDFLVGELRKYTTVNIVRGEWILKVTKLNQQRNVKAGLLDSFEYKKAELIQRGAPREEIDDCQKYIEETKAEIEAINKELREGIVYDEPSYHTVFTTEK